ncbi:MAG: NAD(P)-dependent dehydrogenase (short-subunit alcohol dehydrogenase family) [Alphaproteobacteria bacterium]|jgi:NAD(P)-dependent dehydrogenase (short-subunit alcohol dehydrogenase family)
MPSVMIIGASRGIGLGFVQAYAAADGWQVHATTRTLDTPGELGDVPGDVTLYELDVTDAGQINRLAMAFQDRDLDLLIHNAGVYGTGMSRDLVLMTNAEAPFYVISALLPAIERSRDKKIAILTSHMGARNGGQTPTGVYGASKAALNDRYREIEPQWRDQGIASVIFHPGWVQTDMGGAGASVSVADSVRGMRQVINNLRAANSGKFLDWQGTELSW